MRIVRRLDAGPIADTERVGVGPLDTAAEIEARLGEACVPLLRRALPRLAAGELAFTPQADADATYCRKLTKDDGTLDFSAPAATLAARSNGLFPWPACAIEINGQPVKIGLAEVAPGATGGANESGALVVAGKILGADEAGLLNRHRRGRAALAAAAAPRRKNAAGRGISPGLCGARGRGDSVARDAGPGRAAVTRYGVRAAAGRARDQ